MAQAGKKHIGAGARGKGSGSGAGTEAPAIADNLVLSNRDKSQHSRSRGLDGKWQRTEQLQDHGANQVRKQGG